MVAFYSESGCVNYLSNRQTQDLTTVGSWELLDVTDWTPSGAVSALVLLGNRKDGPGDFQTFHDCVHFGPNPTMIFADGFESIDLSQWSSVEGYPWEGAYDDCNVVPCNAGMDCLALAGISHGPFCSPQCGGGGFCPGRGGVEGSCALSNPPDPPTNCALLCDTATPACPLGMECFLVSGTDGICAWPLP